MSPSEFDLRAALRDGEDEGVDVDGLVASVRARRAQRRTRVLSTAAAVVVVAAAAVGGAAVWGGSDGSGHQAGSTPGVTPSASVHGSPEPAGSQTAGTHPACPAAYPARTTPGSGTSAAAGGPMFAAPVASVEICAFTETGSVTGATAAPLVLTGANATALATSIENASRSRLKVMCPDIEAGEKKQLAIIATTAGGTRLPTVTTDVSIPNCNQPITNGLAVRYAWKPPSSVADLIDSLTTSVAGPTSPAGVVPTLPSGGGGSMNGSPVR